MPHFPPLDRNNWQKKKRQIAQSKVTSAFKIKKNIYIDPPGSGLDSRLTVDRKIHQRPVTSFIFFDNVNSLLLCVSLLYFVPLLLRVWSASSKEKKWEAKRRIGKKEMVAVLILFIVACLWRWCVYVIPYNNKGQQQQLLWSDRNTYLPERLVPRRCINAQLSNDPVCN